MESEACADHLTLGGKYVDDEFEAGVRVETLPFWFELTHFNELAVHNVA